ncbi:hypothetical protein MROS_2350 [Melioribacter roseus P3M-2]|uniref:Uncharacterized protein n=1 Tax=Melioribacter roseus (strain DSM 23840 / JCM 17771 / VKM B-2668 / P3M-2) TaxID=1191523 RepID=I6Z8V2_MELRP|nr:hypothetical protein MROS_2350 [Melioribacter roseus P3M-2]
MFQKIKRDIYDKKEFLFFVIFTLVAPLFAQSGIEEEIKNIIKICLLKCLWCLLRNFLKPNSTYLITARWATV